MWRAASLNRFGLDPWCKRRVEDRGPVGVPLLECRYLCGSECKARPHTRVDPKGGAG